MLTEYPPEGPGEGVIPGLSGLQTAFIGSLILHIVFPLGAQLYVQISPFYKDTNYIGLQPALMTLFKIDSSLKPIFTLDYIYRKFLVLIYHLGTNYSPEPRVHSNSRNEERC